MKDLGRFEQLAVLRALVGFLGEREHHGWWQSSFFSAGSRAFLAPVFGRTQLLAQCSGVTRAASLVHDERIGVGRVFHLFRLPEEIEQGIHQVIQTPSVGQRITACVAHHDVALAYLRTEAPSATGADIGPVEIGSAQDLRGWRLWRVVAAQYLSAFETGVATFPYFADRA